MAALLYSIDHLTIGACDAKQFSD